MLGDGFKLMIVGMGYVFVFLAVMVIVISVTAKLVAPFTGLLDKETQPSGGKRPRGGAPKKDADSSLISAVVAAVHKYRDDHK